ncbi:MAG: ROK family protein [Propionibacteriaceae bacterium]|nr:ROK family protein [Propionibacteriaceae bacterium]
MRIGVDIGGTKTRAVALDEDGRLLGSVQLPTVTGEPGVVATAVDVLRRLSHEVGGTRGASIGVGVPGLVDATGRVGDAVNLGIRNLALRAVLEQELGVAVTVENDVKASAFGAVERLGAWGRTLTLVNFGTGVSSATVVAGRLLRGVGNAAGEIGHIALPDRADPCPCGQTGCLELYAGGAGVGRRLDRLDPPTALQALFGQPGGDHRLPIGHLRTRDELLDAMAFALTVPVIAYGPDFLVVSGGVVENTPGLLPAIEERLGERARRSSFLRSLGIAERIRRLPAEWPVAAIGAALVGARTDDDAEAPRVSGDLSRAG